MRIDGRQLASGSRFKADVCVIGGGPAGLVLTKELAARGLQVCLLERGLVEEDPRHDSLRLEDSESELKPILESRWFQVGGTSAIWNTGLRGQAWGRYVRFDEVDFESRSWMPYSGWPFGLKELTPYYDRVESLVFGAGGRYDSTSRDREIWTAQSHVLESRLDRFAPNVIFMKSLPQELTSDSGVRLLEGVRATEIECDESGHVVTKIQALVRGGAKITVEAKFHVLAAGGLENPRLLLASNKRFPAGLGNGRDLVGRFFMDRQKIPIGHLVPDDARLFDTAGAYDLRRERGFYVLGKLALTSETLRKHELPNSNIHLSPRANAANAAALAAIRALGRTSANPVGSLRAILSGSNYLFATGLRLGIVQRHFPPDLAFGEWSSLKGNASRFGFFELVQQCEQAPDPGNRVALGNEVDREGVLRARVVGSRRALDFEGIRRTREVLAEGLKALHLGTILPPAIDPESVPWLGMHHHMGTTRMHIDPQLGVVDENGRVHGVDNLFVAGSSVFPTSGCANPTLTLLALTLKLADHLVGSVSWRRAALVTESYKPARAKMKAFVTGASGFIGRHLVRELLSRGYEVTGLVRPNRDVSELENLGMLKHVGDVRDPSCLTAPVARADLVFHLASVVDVGDWLRHQAEGVAGTKHVIQAAGAARVRRLVLMSSMSVYAPPRPGEFISEDSPLKTEQECNDSYARQKVLQEQAVWQAQKEGLFDVTVIRAPTVIGAGDPSLPIILQKARDSAVDRLASNGRRHFPFVEVGRLVAGIADAAEQDVAAGKAYNLAHAPVSRDQFFDDVKTSGLVLPRAAVKKRLALWSVSLSLRVFERVVGVVHRRLAARPRTKLVAFLEKQAGRKSREDWILDTSRAQEELGWKPNPSVTGTFFGRS